MTTVFRSPGLVAYEYLITFGEEVTLVWQNKWTGATVLFVSNRYLMLLTTILDVVPLNSAVSRVHSESDQSSSYRVAGVSRCRVVVDCA